MRWLAPIWLAALTPVSLAAAPVTLLSAEQAAAVAQAEERGEQMFRYDRAAWLATDALARDAKGGLNGMVAQGLVGYVVEPGEGDALLVSFYGRKDGRAFALARYTYADRNVTGGLTPDAPALSSMALRLVDARDKAMAVMRQPGHGLCSTSSPNTLVLPLADGGIAAYVLTSTTDAGSYPAGGHYRFDFAADGHLTGERPFMKSCFPISLRAKDGIKPEAMVLTHLLDAQPTEIHAFVSRNVPIALMIVTVSNRMVWGVEKGRITPMGLVPTR